MKPVELLWLRKHGVNSFLCMVYRGGQKLVYNCEYTKHRVYSCIIIYLFIYYCIIYLYYLSSSFSFLLLLLLLLLLIIIAINP